MPKLVLAIVLSLASFAVASNDGEEAEDQCDPAYPDVCIPSPPPDLDCVDIGFRNFKVLPPDPHRFDGNKDGLGCQ